MSDPTDLTETAIVENTPLEKRSNLEDLERSIDTALHRRDLLYIAIGEALKRIREQHLYHGNWEKYVKKRFGFGRSVSADYVNAARVGRALLSDGKPAPMSVRAALALQPKRVRNSKQHASHPGESVPIPWADYVPYIEPSSRPGDTAKPEQVMCASLRALFKCDDVAITLSLTPGRWQINIAVRDATTEQVQRIAQILANVESTPELALPPPVA